MARKVLLLVTDLEIGGTPTVVRELAVRLRARKHDVEVACLAHWGPVASQLRDMRVPVEGLGAVGARDFVRVVGRLVKLIRFKGYDTVFSFLVHANAVAAAARLLCRDVRFFQSIQTTQPEPRWHWKVQRIARHAAERIIVPSDAVAWVAHERSAVERRQIEVIPNAIDPATFPRVDVFQTDVTRVGFLGRLDPVKNVPALIQAMTYLEALPVRCEIFGDGPERARLEEQVDRLKLQTKVHFHGPVRGPLEALRQMDVLVLPSEGEGFGLVLIEAMASGVPVIASGVGGAGDVVEHGVNGLSLGHDHYDRGIQDRVLELRNHPELRQKLIEGGLRTVREKYTWDIVLPQYERALDLR